MKIVPKLFGKDCPTPRPDRGGLFQDRPRDCRRQRDSFGAPSTPPDIGNGSNMTHLISIEVISNRARWIYQDRQDRFFFFKMIMYFIFLLLFVCFVSLWLGFQKALPERSWWTSWWELRGGGGGRGGRGGGGGGGSRWLQFAVFVDAIGWTFLLTGSKEKKKRMSKGKGKLQAPEAYTTPATPATPVTPPLESQQTCFCLFVLWIYPCRLLFSYFSFSFLPPPPPSLQILWIPRILRIFQIPPESLSVRWPLVASKCEMLGMLGVLGMLGMLGMLTVELATGFRLGRCSLSSNGKAFDLIHAGGCR